MCALWIYSYHSSLYLLVVTVWDSPSCAQEENPCTRAPCADGQICVPRRAKCFRREGCAERQRECGKNLVVLIVMHVYYRR